MSFPIYKLEAGGKIFMSELTGKDALLGRSPNATIAIDNQAISFEHGAFTSSQNTWFYKDLGSTNGSKLNGYQVESERWKLIRPGDSLRVADCILILGDAAEAPAAGEGMPKVYVFSERGLIAERDGARSGTTLNIGGADRNFPVVQEPDAAVLTIERQGRQLIAIPAASSCKSELNGKLLSQATVLADKDEISVDRYLVVVSLPPLGAAYSEMSRASVVSSDNRIEAGSGKDVAGRTGSQYDEVWEKSSPKKLPFGKTVPVGGTDADTYVIPSTAELRQEFSRSMKKNQIFGRTEILLLLGAFTSLLLAIASFLAASITAGS